MRIFLYFRALFYFAHWMGCIWWGIGYREYECVQANFRALCAQPTRERDSLTLLNANA